MSPYELFEDWLLDRESDVRDPLSRDAALPYAFIWKKWITWLDSRHPAGSEPLDSLAYLSVSQEDAVAFLEHGPSPAAKRDGRSASRPISRVTRLRYAEVLSRVYAHAVFRGLLASHPFTPSLLVPRPTERERGGQVLPPGVFEVLQGCLSPNASVVRTRDEAIVLLLVECGLTSGELRTLKVPHVRENRDVAGQFWLSLDGPRRAQCREVSTSGDAGLALQRWLACRDQLGKPGEWVFRSTHLDHLAKVTLFALVFQQVEAACRAVGVPCPAHVGPGVIRNSVIVRRLRAGVAPAVVCRDLGIQDPKTLQRGLRHHLELRG